MIGSLHCLAQSVRPLLVADLVENAVWDAVTDALQHPERLAAQYERSLSNAGAASSLEAELKQARAGLKKLMPKRTASPQHM